ncbi:four-helix bundle copper-binding protein [Pseudomonas guariconensis]|uniref:four-helix bundle copper-binding protein n=1 Tax=Pseudomonas guariconensis TaxID=1288410 RepID=UPI0018AA79DC|nr:four-helix bundle copper-binding protein [Pseudomonas guariconensis]MBF8740661.1 four-helix bundle copper-binding protein [Pseudomonas guariconensis]MBF8749841.1 four-helix bundle copper-binding protein [Pseudomonas guariconensis]
MTASVMAATETHESHHEHGAIDGKDFAGLVSTSADCLKTGEACLAHCITLLSQGDKEMAACAQSVSELLATCDALMKLAAQKSKFTPVMAKVTAEVCTSCEKQCRKYEEMQAECKACADSCAACVKECNALAV